MTNTGFSIKLTTCELNVKLTDLAKKHQSEVERLMQRREKAVKAGTDPDDFDARFGGGLRTEMPLQLQLGQIDNRIEMHRTAAERLTFFAAHLYGDEYVLGLKDLMLFEDRGYELGMIAA